MPTDAPNTNASVQRHPPIYIQMLPPPLPNTNSQMLPPTDTLTITHLRPQTNIYTLRIKEKNGERSL